MNETVNLVKYFFETGKFSGKIPVADKKDGPFAPHNLDEIEEMMQFGSWTLDVSSQTMHWTSGMYSLLNYQKSDLPERIPFEFYIGCIAESHRDILTTLVDLATQNAEPFECEYPVSTSLGLERIFLTRAKVIGLAGHIQIAGITRDITPVRLSERECVRSAKALTRSNHDLEEFAYVASHDLQEPLRKITMFSERLKLSLNGNVNQDSEIYFKRIEAASLNMRNMIDSLLEFSRANRGRMPFVTVDLEAVVREVLADLDMKIDESNATIQVSPGLPVVEGNPHELRQLFNNLIANSIKFKKGEPPRISLTGERLNAAQKLSYGLIQTCTYHQITITDNGIGFENRHAERIFQMFQRLHGKADYPGSGIGLAICKKVVNHHNGLIFAEGVPDQGSTFTIILPEKHG